MRIDRYEWTLVTGLAVQLDCSPKEVIELAVRMLVDVARASPTMRDSMSRLVQEVREVKQRAAALSTDGIVSLVGKQVHIKVNKVVQHGPKKPQRLTHNPFKKLKAKD